jgi:hypothetical protein
MSVMADSTATQWKSNAPEPFLTQCGKGNYSSQYSQQNTYLSYNYSLIIFVVRH